MNKQIWNTGWEIAPGVPNPFGAIFGTDAKPVPVMLPQDAMILEERSPDAPSGNQTGYYPVKSYTYTKTFLRLLRGKASKLPWNLKGSWPRRRSISTENW